MKEVKCKLYRFEELSDKVRHEIVEKKRWDVGYEAMECRNVEYRATLEKFEKLFGIDVSYEVDYCGERHCIKSDFYPIGEYCNEISAKELYGKYVLRVLNQIYDDIFPKKRFWGKFKWDENGKSLTKTRYSKILRNYDGCPLTGVCYDVTILEPIKNFLRKPDVKISLWDLVEECLDKFFEEWYKEYEYCCDNDEFIEEELRERWFEDDLFFEDGRKFDGIYDDAA